MNPKIKPFVLIGVAAVFAGAGVYLGQLSVEQAMNVIKTVVVGAF